MASIKTTIGRGLIPVTVEYEVETHEVDRFDRATGSEYSETVVDVEITGVYQGLVEVSGLLTDEVFESLRSDCKAAMDNQKARALSHYTAMAREVA
jgi:hypothetical protein